MLNDVIADLFTRIRNGIKEGHATVTIPHSRLKYRICKLLEENGMLASVELQGESLIKKSIKVGLKYKRSGESIISKIERVSRPSKRVYIQKANIPKILNGYGLAIISTSKGVLTGKEARIKNVGGEFVGVIY